MIFDNDLDIIQPQSSNLTIGGTGSIIIPIGTTAQRPTGVAGLIRFNTDLNIVEGYNSTTGYIPIAHQQVSLAAVTATGSTQTDALQLTVGVINVGTVAAGSGVRLPVSYAGICMTIVNHGLNPVMVYPSSGGAIDNLGLDVGFSLPVNATVELKSLAFISWRTNINSLQSLAYAQGVLPVANGGSGQIGLGTSLQVLRTNSSATATEWATLSGGGSVTSVGASGGTTGLSFTGSPITTSGTLTLSGTLIPANGGTGLTTLGTSLQVLRTNSSATNMEWATVSSSGPKTVYTTINCGVGIQQLGVVISEPTISATSVVSVEKVISASSNKSADEHLIETWELLVGNVQVGVGFTVYIKSTNYNAISGIFNISYSF